MVEDWLALPGEAAPEKSNTVLPPVAADPTMPKVSSQSVEHARERELDEREFAMRWSRLSPRQKIYLRALQQTGFSARRAANILAEAPEWQYGGHAINDKTPQRWARTDANYKFVLRVLKAESVRQVTSRDDLLLRAHRAAEYAEEEQPILHQGQDTGFRERKVGEMLRANEQLMKATKVLGGDDRELGGSTGPALVIQVVQGDGALVDVTPKGVTIDLPRPGGP